MTRLLILGSFLALLLFGCGQDPPDHSQDPGVRRALVDVSDRFSSRGLYDGDFAHDLTSYGWTLELVEPPEYVPCGEYKNAIACTWFGPGPFRVVSLTSPEWNIWPDCPDVPSVLTHEWYHIALYFGGDPDYAHTGPGWPGALEIERDKSICDPSLSAIASP